MWPTGSDIAVDVRAWWDVVPASVGAPVPVPRASQLPAARLLRLPPGDTHTPESAALHQLWW